MAGWVTAVHFKLLYKKNAHILTPIEFRKSTALWEHGSDSRSVCTMSDGFMCLFLSVIVSIETAHTQEVLHTSHILIQ